MGTNEKRETVKDGTEKDFIPMYKEERTKIDFTPTSQEEKRHLQVLVELLHLKRRGDWVLVGEMCGISAKNAENAFVRVYSKHHQSVVNALDKVIENRKLMLNK